jgi:hypothetical protein
MALKRIQPGLRFAPSEFAVTADEMDVYQQYVVINPSYGSAWFGSCPVTGTSGTSVLTLSGNVLADYPRNLEFAYYGTHAATTGTLTVNGHDQFGRVIQEVIVVPSAANGGTTVGTKVFAEVTSGTLVVGTATGNGSSCLGVGTLGTTTLFGLPNRLGGTTDVKMIAWGSNGNPTAIGGGTIAAFVNVPMSAIKAPNSLGGTIATMVVQYKPTFAVDGSIQANMSQRV